MTQDEIFKMAREAGFESHDVMINYRKELVRFYALVIAHEREACAKIADTWKNNVSWEGKTAANNIAHQIRARGEA